MATRPPDLPRVYVASRIPAAVHAALAAEFALVDDAERAQGILVTPDVHVDEAFLSRTGEDLKIVANYAAGVDNVDLPAAARRGLVVANTPDVVTAATAEHTVGLILALLRRIAEGDRLIRTGQPWRFAIEFMLGERLAGKRVAVIGAGRIGREVARLVEALGAVAALVGRSDPLADALSAADVVSLHVPLRPETRHLIDANALAGMRSSAVLVNVSRGPVVDEKALASALERGAIAGAALDVFEFEPDVSPTLVEMENVVLTPHLGSATRETREAMGMLAVSALRAFLVDGELPANRVLPQ
jgi:glyoxylate reductase